MCASMGCWCRRERLSLICHSTRPDRPHFGSQRAWAQRKVNGPRLPCHIKEMDLELSHLAQKHATLSWITHLPLWFYRIKDLYRSWNVFAKMIFFFWCQEKLWRFYEGTKNHWAYYLPFSFRFSSYFVNLEVFHNYGKLIMQIILPQKNAIKLRPMEWNWLLLYE